MQRLKYLFFLINFLFLSAFSHIKAFDSSEIVFKCIACPNASIILTDSDGGTSEKLVISHEFNDDIVPNNAADTIIATLYLGFLDQSSTSSASATIIGNYVSSGSFILISQSNDTITMVIKSDKDSSGNANETILTEGSAIRISGTTETVDPYDYHKIDFYAAQGELASVPNGIYTNTILFELTCSG